MSASERALRLMKDGAWLQPAKAGEYAIHPHNDRRRRPLARLSASDVRLLDSDGAIAARGDGSFALTVAGQARVRREAATPGEAHLAQHRPVVARAIVDADGDARVVRGHALSPLHAKLSAMKDAHGGPWLTAAELRAAAQLSADWERSQGGVVRGSDWSGPPQSGGTRGPNNAQEAAMAVRCDAGKRVAKALDALAPPLRRIVLRICVEEQGLEALERAEGWPARSGRLALKLGLAQLASSL